MVNDSQIKCVLLTLLILASLLLLTASVVLILLISAGLMANSSVSAALCSPYLTTKFGGTSYVTLNAFIASCIAVFGALVFFLTAASTIIVAYFKSSPNRACSITIARLIILYLSNCFTLLASVVTFGYYLSVIIEKDQCLGATNDREIIITALQGVQLALGLSVLVMLAWAVQQKQSNTGAYYLTDQSYSEQENWHNKEPDLNMLPYVNHHQTAEDSVIKPNLTNEYGGEFHQQTAGLQKQFDQLPPLSLYLLRNNPSKDNSHPNNHQSGNAERFSPNQDTLMFPPGMSYNLQTLVTNGKSATVLTPSMLTGRRKLMPKAGHSLSQSSLGDKTKEKNKDEKAEVTMEYQNKSKQQSLRIMQRLQQAIPLKSDGLNQPIVVPEEIKKPKRGQITWKDKEEEKQQREERKYTKMKRKNQPDVDAPALLIAEFKKSERVFDTSLISKRLFADDTDPFEDNKKISQVIPQRYPNKQPQEKQVIEAKEQKKQVSNPVVQSANKQMERTMIEDIRKRYAQKQEPMSGDRWY